MVRVRGFELRVMVHTYKLYNKSCIAQSYMKTERLCSRKVHPYIRVGLINYR